MKAELVQRLTALERGGPNPDSLHVFDYGPDCPPRPPGPFSYEHAIACLLASARRQIADDDSGASAEPDNVLG